MTATAVPPTIGQLLRGEVPADDNKLTPFEGKDVHSATIAIRNAGDGLSSAMSVTPVELHQGATVHVVLECEVEKLRFDPLKDADGLIRVHMLKAGRATLIDAEAVTELLDAQQRRIDEAEGVQQLPFGEDGDQGEDPDVDPDPESDDLANLAEDATK